MTEPQKRSRVSWMTEDSFPWVLLLVVPLFLFVLVLFVGSDLKAILSILDWFDPLFLQYNLLLFLFAVFVVPAITYFYVHNMKGEKIRRLKNELSDEQWEQNGTQLEAAITRSFSMTNYLGSMTALIVVIAFGTWLILLFKPVSSGALGAGVDYSKGANILLLGTYIELFQVEQDAFYHHIILSLTAFQFGFLGAYVYFIGHLVRSYFMLDLTPHTFVASTVRITVGSLLSLVLSFVIAHPFDYTSPMISALPLVSFFLGHFPERALMILKEKATRLLRADVQKYRSTALSQLPGMSDAHEVRIVTEGYDNVENLSNAIPLELVLRTGFSYSQLRQWISQAWLCSHLGNDYGSFVQATGLASADELLELFSPHSSNEVSKEAHLQMLDTATEGKFTEKIHLVCALLPLWKQRMAQAITTV